jgi:hypothetical protein
MTREERRTMRWALIKSSWGVPGSLVGDSMKCADFFPKSSRAQSVFAPDAARTGGDGR